MAKEYKDYYEAALNREELAFSQAWYEARVELSERLASGDSESFERARAQWRDHFPCNDEHGVCTHRFPFTCSGCGKQLNWTGEYFNDPAFASGECESCFNGI